MATYKFQILVGALIGVACALARAAEVIHIGDGDSLTVLRDGAPLRVRLAYVDAPERRQAWGERSRQSLADMCLRQHAYVRVVDVDRYGRAVALVRCGRFDVNSEQVQRGMAWAYTRYNPDPQLVRLETAARAARRGLWQDSEPVAPWQFRSRHR